MQIDERIITPEERAALVLRALYAENGYVPYKLNKFEDYDLYVNNKDFLVSEGIISFTDTNGNLKALKPDVTLSIVRDCSKGADAVTRVYYNETVYRVSKDTHSFQEILQTGLECIGSIGERDISQVLMLALKSLACLQSDHVLDVSHLGIIPALTHAMGLDERTTAAVLKCAGEKNTHGAAAICREAGAEEAAIETLCRLLRVSGSPAETLPELRELLVGTAAGPALAEFEAVLSGVPAEAAEKGLRIDLSTVGDPKYYNGVVFKGYLNGVSCAVLSGGQYDTLLRRMRRGGRAIGFAVYLDTLERRREAAVPEETAWVNVALPKGRLGEKVYEMFESAGYGCPALREPGRKLIFENPANRIRFFWVKPSDVAIYVERGAADLGVAGKDILLEYAPDVYELLDLQIGKCRMAVAAKKDYADDPRRTLRVATKFSNTAQRFYAGKGRDIDVIHLNGSIEIAPILGLSDVIVDIVETGATLRENDLEVKEEIFPISARLIANPAGHKFKHKAIGAVTEALRQIVKEK